MPDDDALPPEPAADEPPVFTLGIAMAGAVSAGAYTAGVLDFLVRALQAHDAMVGQPGGPRHRVVIKAMSGASAGGICAALTTAALTEGPRLTAARMKEGGTDHVYDHVLRPLHEIWVERVDLAQGDALLGLGDLRKGELRSLINSEVLDRQAKAALEPVAWDGRRHGWLAEDVEIFLTTTHLDGVPFVAPFREGGEPQPGLPASGHVMARHDFARHFRVSGLGATRVESPWLDMWGDDGVPLVPPPAGEPVPFQAEGEPWSELRLTAFASGAFPAGLESRFMQATVSEFHVPFGSRGRGGALPYDIDPAERPCPADPYFRDDPAAVLVVHAVDGGVCNNEPFELVRFAIRPRGPDGRLAPNPRGAVMADRAVIMIDPFPEGPTFKGPKPAEGAGLLTATLGKLIPTLLNQARFKPHELLEATDPEVHSRWLIAPSRRRYDDEGPTGDRRDLRLDRRGAEAIACGFLGGFGGFLHENFRRHDFILGQRNCQSFLIKHFTVDEANPIDHARARGVAATGRKVPIIHLTEDLKRPIALPPWPAMPTSRYAALKRKINDRIEAVVDHVLRANLNGVGRMVVKFGYAVGGRGKLQDAVAARLRDGLKSWELL